MEDSIMIIDNISLSFGKHKILDNINFNIKPKEIYGIIGPSGSGKTTILNVISGFYEPDKGNVLYKLNEKAQFKRISKNMDEVKKRFGFSSQFPSFYDKLTVDENLLYFSEIYNVKKDLIKENIDAILRLVGLTQARNYLAGDLSGGMKKRLDIGCAFIHSPDILVLDEPTSDLDPFLRKQIWSLIKRINEKGRTIIISSHSLEELQHLCDEIAIIKDGRVMESGKINNFKKKYDSGEEIHLESSPGNYENLVKQLRKDKKEIRKIENRGHKLIIYTHKSETILHDILHILEKNREILLNVEVNKPTLNEIFEEIVSKK